ncbi:helix-turn-helix domain-containing protein [Nocardioides panacisoli]|uniref:helix-turn-helix domain-containing protein n=1 Tax=Nocardioides panacisoli TaxID=627624 RepID=UPI001C63AED6|nr:helix-turn-helix domain-containing protein [Nocardioides panacisoli]QYJ05239.1 helix-turn-helix domain-containing protein [Nocardioides panacisoli]
MATTTSIEEPSEPRWLTLAAAARRVDVSVKTIRRRIATGELPAYTCGKTRRPNLRVKPEDVDALMRPIPSARS